MKYDLITVKRNEVFTDSKVIANGTHNKHESIQRIINKYKDDFEEFGKLRFSDLKSENPKGGRPEVIYLLNEEQATLSFKAQYPILSVAGWGCKPKPIGLITFRF